MDALPHYAKYMAHNPCRTPDWRLRRAQSLVEQDRYATRKQDDEWTRHAVHYLRSLRKRAGGRSSRRSSSAQPHVHAAVRLHEEDKATALVVQGRLLARQTPDDIARLTGIAPEVVDAYECLFFHVRSYLHARDWVTAQAIFTGPNGAAETLPAAVFKKYAFFGGPLALEAMQPYLVGGKDPFQPVTDLATPEGRLDQLVRFTVACELLPRSARNDLKVLKITLMLREFEQKRLVEPRWTPFPAQNYASQVEHALADDAFQHVQKDKVPVVKALLTASRESA